MEKPCIFFKMATKIGLLLAMLAALDVASSTGNLCLDDRCVDEPSRAKRSSDDAVAHTIREGIDGLAILLKHGIPELGIQSLEPAKLDNFYYDGSHMGTKIKSNFTNMMLYGISNVQVKSVQVSMSKLTLQFKLNFPVLTINGTYNLTGRMIGLVPVYGNDRFNIVATDVKVTAKSTLKTRSNGSLSVDDLQLDMEVDTVNMHFHKLNGGGNTSGVLNRVINFFAEKIFEQSKPKLLQRMKTALETTINRKLAAINVFKV